MKVLSGTCAAALLLMTPAVPVMATCTVNAGEACCCTRPADLPAESGCCTDREPLPADTSADSSQCDCMFQPYDGMLPVPVLTLPDTTVTNPLPNFRPATMRTRGMHSCNVRHRAGESRPPGRVVPLFLANRSYLI